MNRSLLALIILVVPPAARGAAVDQQPAIHMLYQVGKDGNYCLSLTPDTSGCVSGADQNKNPINVLNFPKGDLVKFVNLSDAVHDMQFTGNNKEDMPAQAPKAAIEQKLMRVEDLQKRAINCSFHGMQLGVGYRVPGAAPIQQEQPSGHSGNGDLSQLANQAANAEERKVINMGLADVSDVILAKGSQEAVQKLVKARPDLIPKLAEARPEMAAQIGVMPQGNGMPSRMPIVMASAKNSIGSKIDQLGSLRASTLGLSPKKTEKGSGTAVAIAGSDGGAESIARSTNAGSGEDAPLVIAGLPEGVTLEALQGGNYQAENGATNPAASGEKGATNESSFGDTDQSEIQQRLAYPRSKQRAPESNGTWLWGAGAAAVAVSLFRSRTKRTKKQMISKAPMAVAFSKRQQEREERRGPRAI